MVTFFIYLILAVANAGFCVYWAKNGEFMNVILHGLLTGMMVGKLGGIL